MNEVLIDKREYKNGTFSYRYRFEVASIDGKRRWKSKSGFKTKKEAREAARLAQKMYEQGGEIIEQSDMSYADFLDQWIEMDCKISCKDITVKNYEKKIRLYIKPNLGEYRLKTITKNMLQTFIVKMFNDGFSTNTISTVRGIITKSFDFAVDRHYIQVSPATKLVTPINLQPQKTTRQKPHVYIPEEKMQEIFDRFPEGTTAYIPLLIAYHTGLRLGEIYGLVWDDIDFENKTLSVNRQVQWYQGERSKKDKKESNGTAKSNGYWYFSEPKYKSYRTIDIDDVLVGALLKEKSKQEKAESYYDEYYAYYYAKYDLYIVKNGSNKNVPPINMISTEKTAYEVNFICRRENGAYVTPRTTQHISSVIHKQLNFPEFDIHSLRHTHGTMLMENGADMVYIQHRLGHKDIKVTMNIYTNHITPKIKERNINMLNNIFDNQKS